MDRVGHFLEQVSTRAADRDEPLWSALVVSKGSGEPSSGFYVLARRLREEYADLGDKDVWEKERGRCYDAARSA
ncbi:hypothetical protein M8542_11085 [Amycolatopsis sp. OK19-0408]|uniref:Uncharacterized protein n=1 Tax=Amycolatopsis iheyensis TaxID=2945988 RepID=A0A9X2N9W0_9PSEU|nr:hypothetical protein [Amycolatopsis iheyensis]MCR6483362.1 hypothetical protein [Amycolatopsis iheyensis]